MGVSRASKSSTCFYLAYEGIRAANVPLIPGIPPPTQLFRLPQIQGCRLADQCEPPADPFARHGRTTSISNDSDPYLDKRSIAREMIEANRIMDQHNWGSIDVSYMAIEEIAREVVRSRDLRGKKRR